MITRCGYAEVWERGEVVERKEQMKFAPMGSRTCFPVETIIFAAICESEIRRITGKPARSTDYQIYGDDIVVRTEYYTAIIKRLTELGFIPNLGKSFGNSEGHFFRESCGGEYYDGVDVTPVRIPRNFTDFEGYMSSPKVEKLYDGTPYLDRPVYTGAADELPAMKAAWVQLANNLGRSGFKFAKRYLYDRLKQMEFTDYLVFDDGKTGLQWFEEGEENTALTKVWIGEWQACYVICLTIKPEYINDSIAYRLDNDQAYYNPDYKLQIYNYSDMLERIRLSEYLRLTRHRERLLFPEDLVQPRLDFNKPFTLEVSMQPSDQTSIDYYVMNDQIAESLGKDLLYTTT
jgi:hypothetical protein